MHPYISKIEIENIRSIGKRECLDCSPRVNILVGANNGGKSTVLRCLQAYQYNGLDARFLLNFIRVGEDNGQIALGLKNAIPQWVKLFSHHNRFKDEAPKVEDITIGCHVFHRGEDGGSGLSFGIIDPGEVDFDAVDHAHTGIQNKEGTNLFVYFLSKRKVTRFQHEHNSESALSVRDDLRNLNSKISRIKGAQKSIVREFEMYSEKILGIDFSSLPVKEGVDAGIHVNDVTSISVSSMGEGTGHILGLICDLCLAPQGKVFLIEELENDLHPAALKALLDLIIVKSELHQFFVSTHSNIVLRHLGSVATSQIFNFDMEYMERVPTTKITQVVGEIARQSALRKLGYDPIDFGLWAGYVILEESSAQAIIEHILVEHFVPTLRNKVRFISSNGASQVESKYIDFHRLFVYLQKTEIYERASWVIVDGDEAGKAVITELQKKFQNTDPLRLIALSKENFEEYYPERFQEEVRTALGISNKQQKREAKAALIEQVKEWAKTNPEDARAEFETTAAEVIEILRQISRSLHL